MNSRMYIILLLIGCGIYYAIMLPSYRKKKKEQKEYIRSNPDVVKVYIKPAMDQNIDIKSVDGEKPNLFNEGLKWGFLVKAGERELEMQSRISEKTSMIIMEEATETIYGSDKISFRFEECHKYQLTFDGEIKAYKIDPIE